MMPTDRVHPGGGFAYRAPQVKYLRNGLPAASEAAGRA
jgi:hypothetical protein